MRFFFLVRSSSPSVPAAPRRAAAGALRFLLPGLGLSSAREKARPPCAPQRPAANICRLASAQRTSPSAAAAMAASPASSTSTRSAAATAASALTSFGVVAGFKATVAAPAASIAATILRAVSPVPKAFLCPPPVVSPPPPPPPPPPAGFEPRPPTPPASSSETATTAGTRASRARRTKSSSARRCWSSPPPTGRSSTNSKGCFGSLEMLVAPPCRASSCRPSPCSPEAERTFSAEGPAPAPATHASGAYLDALCTNAAKSSSLDEYAGARLPATPSANAFACLCSSHSVGTGARHSCTPRPNSRATKRTAALLPLPGGPTISRTRGDLAGSRRGASQPASHSRRTSSFFFATTSVASHAGTCFVAHSSKDGSRAEPSGPGSARGLGAGGGIDVVSLRSPETFAGAEGGSARRRRCMMLPAPGTAGAPFLRGLRRVGGVPPDPPMTSTHASRAVDCDQFAERRAKNNKLRKQRVSS